MPGATPRLPELYQPIQMGPGQDFHVSEFTADSAGAMSPFGPDVEFPLPLDRLSYVHPVHLPHRAGVPDA
jgi:hypothetical protein